MDRDALTRLLTASGASNNFPVGHSHSHTIWDGRATLLDLAFQMSDQELNRWANAYEAQQLPLTDPIRLKSSSRLQCEYCQSRAFTTDGVEIHAVDDCPYPDGITVTIELAVPSGRLIVGNDFRPEFDIPEHYNVNSAAGRAATTHDMAANGCAHFFVSNTCPDVYRTGSDQLTIASCGWDETTDRPIEPAGDRVAGVLTDLWWTSMVDGDEFDRRGCQYSHDEIAVTPGIYTFNYSALEKSFDRDDTSRPQIYARCVLQGASPSDLAPLD